MSLIALCAAAANYEYGFNWYFRCGETPQTSLTHGVWYATWTAMMLANSRSEGKGMSSHANQRAYQLCGICSQDGTIQHEVKLTGEVSTTLASPADGTDPKHGEARHRAQRPAAAVLWRCSLQHSRLPAAESSHVLGGRFVSGRPLAVISHTVAQRPAPADAGDSQIYERKGGDIGGRLS